MADPNIVTSGLSRALHVDGLNLQIEIYRLEHQTEWTLEVVEEDGTSTTWDDPFETDQAALDEALRTIRENGVSAFQDGGNVIRFPG
jgi:hypothetical protein